MATDLVTFSFFYLGARYTTVISGPDTPPIVGILGPLIVDFFVVSSIFYSETGRSRFSVVLYPRGTRTISFSGIVGAPLNVICRGSIFYTVFLLRLF